MLFFWLSLLCCLLSATPTREKEYWIKSLQRLQKSVWTGVFHQGFCLERRLQRGYKSEVWILSNRCLNEDLWVWNPLASCKVGSAGSVTSPRSAQKTYETHIRATRPSVSVQREESIKRFKQSTLAFWDSLGQIQFNLEVYFSGIRKSWLKRIYWHNFSLLSEAPPPQKLDTKFLGFFFPSQFWKLSTVKLTQGLCESTVRYRRKRCKCNLEPKEVCAWERLAAPMMHCFRAKDFNLPWKENRRWENPRQNAKLRWNAVRWNRTWCCPEEDLCSKCFPVAVTISTTPVYQKNWNPQHLTGSKPSLETHPMEV